MKTYALCKWTGSSRAIFKRPEYKCQAICKTA